jgi:hypothetical protein
MNDKTDTSMSGVGTCFLSPAVEPFCMPLTAIFDNGRYEDECVAGEFLTPIQREFITRAVNAHGALLTMRAKYNRLHDVLSAMFDAGSPTPDDIKSVADMLAECVAADDAVALILDGK